MRGSRKPHSVEFSIRDVEGQPPEAEHPPGALPTIIVGGTYEHAGSTSSTPDGSAADYNGSPDASVFTTTGLAVATSMLTDVVLIGQLELNSADLATKPTGVIEAHAIVTRAGDNTLTPSGSSPAVRMITPLRIKKGPAGRRQHPGVFVERLLFVPGWRTPLLLVSGAAGLNLIGRRRRKNGAS